MARRPPGLNRALRSAGGGALAASAMLLALCAFAFAVRPIPLAAITVLPVWAWAFPGVWLALMGGRARKRHVIALCLLWLIYLAVLAEEPRSLVRLAWVRPTRHAEPGVIRVVSLNCAVANRLAAYEAARFQPDIVLYQESPGSRDLAEVARVVFGRDGVFTGTFGCAIVARGSLLPDSQPNPAEFVLKRARIRLKSGSVVEAASLRLNPAVTRLDYWNPACWKAHAANRRASAAQARLVADYAASVPRDIPLILGGDFNVPQNDSTLRVLDRVAPDAFRRAGAGWGNTFLGSFPVLRIDQVRASRHFLPVRVFAARAENSDHRMVVCDLKLRDIRKNGSR